MTINVGDNKTKISLEEALKRFEIFLEGDFKTEDRINVAKTREEFVKQYPIDRIANLTFDEYCRDEESFTKKIRWDLRWLASMGNAYPDTFGIYVKKETGEVAMSKTFDKLCNGNVDVAFKTIISEIVKLLSDFDKVGFEAINGIHLNKMFVYKLLLIYYPERTFHVCARGTLQQYCECVGLQLDTRDEMYVGIQKLLEWKETEEAFSGWDNTRLMWFCDFLVRSNYCIGEDKMKYSFDNSKINDCIRKLMAIMELDKYDSYKSCLIWQQEDYKEKLVQDSKSILDVDSWTEDKIGSGEICSRIIKMLDYKIGPGKVQNLVAWQYVDTIKKTFNEKTYECENALYELYVKQNDKEAYDLLENIFGRKFPLISYLFFLKDSNKYVTVRPSEFAKRFEMLGVETDCLKECSWDNLNEFAQIIKDLGMIFEDNLEEEVNLLDAHSLVWMLWQIEDKKVTEWCISGNPKRYDVINAFHDLGKVDWKQTANFEVGDIVYIYVSATYQQVKFKCRVNKIDLKNVEIEDSKYNLSGEFDGSYGRYMELELIEEFNTGLFDRVQLEKFGFNAPQSPIKVTKKLKEYLDITQRLLKAKEIDPYKYDGTYELIQETVKAYKNTGNVEAYDVSDLNLLYHMVIGSWAFGIEKKKESVEKSHLSDVEKERIKKLIDVIWQRANNGEYENCSDNKCSIGMFGAPFMAFKVDTEAAKNFIKLCIELIDLEDDDKIFEVVSYYFIREYTGLKTGTTSEMLHCLKPKTFPILNTVMGNNTIYEYFGLNLQKKNLLTTFISNCKLIKEFRDTNFSVKNYRIFDLVAHSLKSDYDDVTNENDYIPKIEDYDPAISSEEYKSILADEKIIKRRWLDVLYNLYKMGGEATCKQIANTYGNTPMHYSAHATNIAQNILRYTNCPVYDDEVLGGKWCILFYGKYAESDEAGRFKWKLREPLKEAIKELDEEGWFDMINDFDYPLNTILYGPPGTGKTYNSVIYAVAICEKKNIEDLIKEVNDKDYSFVLQRFNKYRDEGRIAFTTFHQSYGYEEFIEGIKPMVDESEDVDGNLEYVLEDGLFKKFCNRAMIPTKRDNDVMEYGLNKDPKVWKVSLKGSYDNEVRTECFENNHIRIGWDGYGENITDDINYIYGGKTVLNSFINKMQIGDIVLSCYNSTNIDGIGVVTGECEWGSDYGEYKRIRNVKWLAKGINYNIVEMNGGTVMVQSSVYKLKVSVPDVFRILDEVGVSETKTTYEPAKNFVFIIDEINRGNISKIFGELITLIEDSKRIGAAEELLLELPYSKKKFGVPNNVYIIGTMNTADRSIALMDTALRRRFKFTEMMPDSDVLNGIVVEADGEEIDIAKLLEIINKRIEYLYDREHTIGHSFFIPLKDDPSIEVLADIFDKNVIPLLKEYFYEDYSKIQLVLGDNNKLDEYKFIIENKLKLKDVFDGDISDLDIPEQTYSIQTEALSKIQSYKGISKDL